MAERIGGIPSDHPLGQLSDWKTILAAHTQRRDEAEAELYKTIDNPTPRILRKLWHDVTAHSSPEVGLELLGKRRDVEAFVTEVLGIRKACPELPDHEINQLLNQTDTNEVGNANWPRISELLLVAPPGQPEADPVYMFPR